MKTEFMPEAEPDRPEHFQTRRHRQKETTASLFINVIQYRGVVEMTGIAGRITMTPTELRSLIEDLEAAEEFIEEHPPRQKEKDT